MTVFAVATPATASAQALSAIDQADGRCMAALTALSEKSSGDDKAALDSSMMYFMGKIVGRSGKSAVGPAVGAGAATLKEATIPDVAQRCANEIEETTKAM